MESKNNKLTNTFQKMMVLMLLFGLGMGVVFPFYADFFVNWVDGLKVWFIAGSLLAGLIVGVSNFLIVKFTIKKTTQDLSEAMSRLSNKECDLTQELQVKTNDDFGRLATAFNSIIANLNDRIQVLNEVADGNLAADFELLSEQDKLGVAIKKMKEGLVMSITTIATNVQTLSAIANKLSSISSKMGQARSNIDAQAVSVSTAARHIINKTEETATNNDSINHNIQSISASSVQMSANLEEVNGLINRLADSIETISNQATQAKQQADQAQQLSNNAKPIMEALSQSTDEINEFVEFIKQIASQTKLLALNANIEAASAGEAGKGFAVVANEIKELAAQSTKTAENISGKITGIQKNTQESVSFIQEISNNTNALNQSSKKINTMVKDQLTTTNTIVSNINDSTFASKEITKNIEQISFNAREAATVSLELQHNTKEIEGKISEVNQSIEERSSGIELINSESNQIQNVISQLNQVTEKFILS